MSRRKEYAFFDAFFTYHLLNRYEMKIYKFGLYVISLRKTYFCDESRIEKYGLMSLKF